MVPRFDPVRRLVEILETTTAPLRSFVLVWVILGVVCAQVGLVNGRMNFSDGVPRANFDYFGWALLCVLQLFTTENWYEAEMCACLHRLAYE